MFQDWTLHLRFATERDAGLYECQISTHPPTSLFVELQLVGKLVTLHRQSLVRCLGGVLKLLSTEKLFIILLENATGNFEKTSKFPH